MKRFLAWLAAEYGYTPRQSVQLLALLCTALGFLAVPLVYKAWLLGRPQGPLPPVELVVVEDSGSSAPPVREAEEETESSPGAIGRQLHVFDPNVADEAEWQRLGAPAWLARRIVHYRAKGGRFRSAEDIGRIYDFPPDLLEELRPYVRIGGKAEVRNPVQEKSIPEKPVARTYPVLDLNTADSAELEALPQLGPATARNIVKYRKLLGGFYRPEQLYELYNQDSARTAVFLPYLKVYPGEGKTMLDVNTLARSGKLYHPYLPKASARLISAWVRQHGNLARAEQLVEHQLIDTASLRKLRPYLSF